MLKLVEAEAVEPLQLLSRLITGLFGTYITTIQTLFTKGDKYTKLNELIKIVGWYMLFSFLLLFFPQFLAYLLLCLFV